MKYPFKLVIECDKSGQFSIDGWENMGVDKLEVVPAEEFEAVADALNRMIVKTDNAVKEIEEYQASRSAPGIRAVTGDKE
jgi:hypothetical protein